MKRRLAQILFIALALLALTFVIVAICFYLFGGRLEITDAFVFGTTAVLLSFLGLLVLRCVTLTTISLIEHLRRAREPQAPVDCPPF